MQTDVTLNGVAEPYGTLGLRLTVPFTALGGPALSVPCGFSAAGLPIGLQIAGLRFDEPAVFEWATPTSRVRTGTDGALPSTVEGRETLVRCECLP